MTDKVRELLREAREALHQMVMYARVEREIYEPARATLDRIDAALSTPDAGKAGAGEPFGWLIPQPHGEAPYLFSKTNMERRPHWLPIWTATKDEALPRPKS